MKIAVDLVSPWARILLWAGLPLGIELDPFPPDEDPEGYDLLLRFSPEAFPGDERAHPGRRAIEAYGDLLIQKRLFRALSIPTPPFGRVRGAGEWEAMVTVHGLPAWLRERKTGRSAWVAEREFEPPEGLYLYERAYPYEAELLFLAVRGEEGVRLFPPAVRRGEAWVAPFPLEKALWEGICQRLEHLLAALGHRGGIEVRAGRYQNEVYFLDFAPFPTERSLFAPVFAEAHFRALLGYGLPETEIQGYAGVRPVEDLSRALAYPYAWPFVLERPYVRVWADDETTLLQRLLEVGGGA